MRRTVGWSSMTRMLGPLRTSGRLTVTAKRSVGRTNQGSEYYTRLRLPVMVMQVTFGRSPEFRLPRQLLGFRSTLSAILEPSAALIVLGAG